MRKVKFEVFACGHILSYEWMNNYNNVIKFGEYHCGVGYSLNEKDCVNKEVYLKNRRRNRIYFNDGGRT